MLAFINTFNAALTFLFYFAYFAHIFDEHICGLQKSWNMAMADCTSTENTSVHICCQFVCGRRIWSNVCENLKLGQFWQCSSPLLTKKSFAEALNKSFWFFINIWSVSVQRIALKCAVFDVVVLYALRGIIPHVLPLSVPKCLFTFKWAVCSLSLCLSFTFLWLCFWLCASLPFKIAVHEIHRDLFNLPLETSLLVIT